jgi:hypothetical protein
MTSPANTPALKNPELLPSGQCSKHMHRQFIQAVQQTCIEIGIQHRIDAPPRRLEDIDRMEKERFTKRDPVGLPIASVWCAKFQVYYGDWRTLACEYEPMTPQTHWTINPEEWSWVLAEIGRDASR